MPGVLNSCWVVLALCAVVHYLRHGTHANPAARLKGALALVCLLALLFPVISADDDLLQQQVASEADSFSCIIKAAGNPQKSKARVTAVLVPASVIAAIMTPLVDKTIDFTPPVYRSLRSHTTGDRSPPQI